MRITCHLPPTTYRLPLATHHSHLLRSIWFMLVILSMLGSIGIRAPEKPPRLSTERARFRGQGLRRTSTSRASRQASSRPPEDPHPLQGRIGRWIRRAAAAAASGAGAAAAAASAAGATAAAAEPCTVPRHAARAPSRAPIDVANHQQGFA